MTCCGLDLLGVDDGDSYGVLALIGEYDITDSQRQMNTIKQVTVSIARALLRGGQRVAKATIETAQGGLFQRELPLVNTLKGTLGHLDWHAAELAKQSDPTAMYAPGQDLKKWCMQAFIDANAVEEGRGQQEQIWTDMWTDIGDAVMKLPHDIAKAVADTAGSLAKGIGGGLAEGLGIPTWLFWTGGVALVGGIGYGVWKVLMAATPAVAGVVAKRYLP